MSTPYRPATSATPAHAIVSCSFYIRTRASGGWRYSPVDLSDSEHQGHLRTTHPPATGDLIYLYDRTSQEGGAFRVIERAWQHSSWGSVNWPYTEAMPAVGPALDVIVEPATGLFRDEAPKPEEET